MIMKKLISLCLAFILVFSLVPLSVFEASAATVTEEVFAAKLAQLRMTYPEGKRWNKANGLDSEGIAKAGDNVCSGYVLYNDGSIGAKCTSVGYCGSGPRGCTCDCGQFNGFQCFGFANLMAYKIFGSAAIAYDDPSATYTAAGWQYLTGVSTFYAGDVVRVNNVHTIFITKVTDTMVYYVECNNDGPCAIDWDNERSITSLKSVATYVVRMSGNKLTGTGAASSALTVQYHANGATIPNSEITGYTYQVTSAAGVNMRSGPGLGYNQITALANGVTFSVNIGDVQSADGYAWGKTTVNGVTGWVVIATYVTRTGSIRASKYYLYDSLVYISSPSALLTQKLNYGVTAANGLYTADALGLTKEGYTFAGWSTTGQGGALIAAGQSLKPEQILPEAGSQTVTLYAVWEENTPAAITLSFHANGGSGRMDEIHGVKGSSLALPYNCFTNAGCPFEGWTVQRDDGRWYTDTGIWSAESELAQQGSNKAVLADGETLLLNSPLVTLSGDHGYTLYAQWGAHSHDWTEASCVAPKTCKTCGATQGAALEHSYQTVTVAPTCTTAGSVTKSCSVCGHSQVTALPLAEHSYSTYVIEPTCLTGGYTTYICAGCAGSYVGNNTPAKGHSFVNGKCTACGAPESDEGADVIKPVLTLKSPTLEFKDMITVNAMFTAENTEDVVEMGMITYSSKVAAWNVETAEHVIPGAAYDAATGRYIAHSQGIHAKYLGDTVYLACYAKLTDGSYVYSKLAPYSPVQYATGQLKNSTDPKLKQLVVAMLNYGAQAQLYFGHNTGSLANAALTAAQKALPEAYRADMVQSVPATSAAKQGIFANNSGFTSRYPAISFEGAFCINYFFTPRYAPTDGITLYYWNAEDYNGAQVLTTANATGKLKLQGSSEYRGDITDISAKNLSEAVYVAAAYKSGGTVWTSGVLGYSIGAYCSGQSSKGTAIAALAEATAVYGYHAKQYFGS